MVKPKQDFNSLSQLKVFFFVSLCLSGINSMRAIHFNGKLCTSYFILIVLICMIGLLLVGCDMHKPVSMKVMSYNIRYDNPDDGENNWRFRRQHVAETIKKHKPAVIGIQEALQHQLNELDSLLADYTWVGVGRDDGKAMGEFTAIFYLKTRLTLDADSTFWLSPIPDIPNIGWDAALNRTVTWAKFKDSMTNKTFYLFNTHFDHRGQLARLESAKLLKKQIRRIADAAPVIVTGDFNFTPKSEPYAALTDTTHPAEFARLFDTQDLSASAHSGPRATFNGFDPTHVLSAPIDYVLIGPGFKILSHEHIAESFNGRAASDHFPVLVEMQL